MTTYRLKTFPGRDDDKLEVGHNGLLAATKAAAVAKESGLVVTLEKFDYALGNYVPDEVFFPKTPSERTP